MARAVIRHLAQPQLQTSMADEMIYQTFINRSDDFAEARAAISKWIQWYNAEGPHQALGYRSPRQFRALQLQHMA